MTRRHRPRLDRVRAVIPVEAFGDSDARARFAEVLAKRLPDGYEVTHRNDQGIAIVGRIARAGQGGGAVSSAVALLVALERALESMGPNAAPALEELVYDVTVKTQRQHNDQ